MAKNPTMSTILGAAGAASALYGGYQQGQAQTAQERLATFGSVGGPPGGDVATLGSFTKTVNP